MSGLRTIPPENQPILSARMKQEKAFHTPLWQGQSGGAVQTPITAGKGARLTFGDFTKCNDRRKRRALY
ncbi:MAG: hypothetical protein IJO06_10075 [Thermoguttaceae bacterium]|nr:hypothetical protein [Thermoguttaceae bacterium]